MRRIQLDTLGSDFNKYDHENIRFLDKGSHYELIFTDDFVAPGGNLSRSVFPSGMPIRLGSSTVLTDIIMDMREGDKDKELHIFVGSFGGEVAALNMIMQQILTYNYRVGINLGTACSCGWMLLFACHERYVSPFSQAMYHDISSVYGGKHTELQRNAEFMGRWQKELLKITDTVKVLTEKELELGRTSEVWFTGRELIDRGAVRDYNEYLERRIPMPGMGFVFVNGSCYTRIPEGWVEVKPVEGQKPMTYEELVKKANAPVDMKDLLSSKKQFSSGKKKAVKEKESDSKKIQQNGAKSGSISVPPEKNTLETDQVSEFQK